MSVIQATKLNIKHFFLIWRRQAQAPVVPYSQRQQIRAEGNAKRMKRVVLIWNIWYLIFVYSCLDQVCQIKMVYLTDGYSYLSLDQFNKNKKKEKKNLLHILQSGFPSQECVTVVFRTTLAKACKWQLLVSVSVDTDFNMKIHHFFRGLLIYLHFSISSHFFKGLLACISHSLLLPQTTKDSGSLKLVPTERISDFRAQQRYR